MNTQWNVGLSPWTLEDGNYWNGTDHGFYCGQMVDFALEFDSRGLKQMRPAKTSARHLREATYHITGKVVFSWEHGWIVDIGGVLAYSDLSKPKLPAIGTWVTGDIYLGVDHFAYIERLYQLPGMPPLIYSWRIDAIVEETAPVVGSTNANGRTIYVPDKTRSEYKELLDTYMPIQARTAPPVVDPSLRKYSHYVLGCSRIGEGAAYTARPSTNPKYGTQERSEEAAVASVERKSVIRSAHQSLP